MRSVPSADAFVRALASYIERDLAGGRGPIDPDASLFDDGLIDSLKILQLIAFVEHWTGTSIPDSAVVMENFRSVRRIAERFVGASTPGVTASARME
jgi:acyl carrier protein